MEDTLDSRRRKVAERAAEPIAEHRLIPTTVAANLKAAGYITIKDVLIRKDKEIGYSSRDEFGEPRWYFQSSFELEVTARLFLYVLEGEKTYTEVDRAIGPFVLKLVALWGTNAAVRLLAELGPWPPGLHWLSAYFEHGDAGVVTDGALYSGEVRGEDLQLRRELRHAESQFRSWLLSRGIGDFRYWEQSLRSSRQIESRHEANWFRFGERQQDQDYERMSPKAALSVRGSAAILPILFALGWMAWILATNIASLFVGPAIAASAAKPASSFVPPLGLSQPIFTVIICAFVALLFCLIAALTWKGYFAATKSTKAATIVEHFASLVLGAFFGTKL